MTLQAPRVHRGTPTLPPELRRVLLGAYAPCPAFANTCSSMRWAPDRGHVPRGFCGATGALTDVQLVLVVAEPGDPQAAERYPAAPEACLDAAYAYAYEALRSGLDVFHRNLRHVLDLCWPTTSFEEQLRRTWITESVLCSAAVECGPVASGPERACRTRYLEAQLALLPHSVVVALGSKAQHRLRGLPGVLSAFAVAPPGCNHRGARASWAAVAELVHQRTKASAIVADPVPGDGGR